MSLGYRHRTEDIIANFLFLVMSFPLPVYSILQKSRISTPGRVSKRTVLKRVNNYATASYFSDWMWSCHGSTVNSQSCFKWAGECWRPEPPGQQPLRCYSQYRNKTVSTHYVQCPEQIPGDPGSTAQAVAQICTKHPSYNPFPKKLGAKAN